MNRDDVIALLRDVVQRYCDSGADDYYIGDVRSACEGAFNDAATKYGWEKLREGELA